MPPWGFPFRCGRRLGRQYRELYLLGHCSEECGSWRGLADAFCTDSLGLGPWEGRVTGGVAVPGPGEYLPNATEGITRAEDFSFPLPPFSTWVEAGGRRAEGRIDADYLDWSLEGFSGCIAADPLYDGPYCVLSIVDDRPSSGSPPGSWLTTPRATASAGSFWLSAPPWRRKDSSCRASRPALLTGCLHGSSPAEAWNPENSGDAQLNSGV